jgi:hypothetical protein
MEVLGIAGQLCSGKDVLADYLVERMNEAYYKRSVEKFRKEVQLMRQTFPESTMRDIPEEEIINRVKNLPSTAAFIWQRSAFASAVKETFQDTFGVDRNFIEQWKRDPNSPPGFLKNIRQSLQFIGDGFRQIKDGIWIEIALRDETKNLIISDSRYINEARAIKKKGGFMLVLYRPGFMNDDPNPSESQIKPVVQWCLNTNQVDGPLNFDVPKESYAVAGVTEEVMSNYDLFINNDGTMDDLYAKVDNVVVPWLRDKYGLSCLG